MWQKHHEIKRLMFLEFTPKRISEIIGCTPENICAITGSELFKRELAVMSAARDASSIEVSKHIQKIGSKGLRLLEDVVDGIGEGKGADIGLRAKISMDMLDRRPESAKVRNIKGDVTHTHAVDNDTLDRIKGRAREAQRIERVNGNVVDAEVVSVE
jgi:hypothetical protein